MSSYRYHLIDLFFILEKIDLFFINKMFDLVCIAPLPSSVADDTHRLPSFITDATSSYPQPPVWYAHLLTPIEIFNNLNQPSAPPKPEAISSSVPPKMEVFSSCVHIGGASLNRPSEPPKPAAPPKSRSTDCRAVEAAHTQPEDRVAALRAYRRARGLCFTCGEWWGRAHRCGPTIQLHVVEELIDMMTNETPSTDEPSLQCATPSEEEADCCIISQEAVEGAESPTTMRLHGWVQDREVLMLVDSGSSHSFICESLAEHLQGVEASKNAMAVRVANGGVMHCNRELPACSWRTQGVTFHTDLKVLPLGCYDVILGIDWLSQHSPMNVHWKEKTMQFEYDGKQVHLAGAQADTTQCQQLSGEDLERLLQRSGVARVIHLCVMASEGVKATELPVPTAVTDLLREFQHLFEEPRGLPPRRAFDHAIPLLPGAKPVNVRPYRYSPAQKDEIERQVADMLAQGIIVPSSSPFASPVLLVQKKDLTWRFCVDYRRLNDATVKNKFPLPIVDELLDELAGAALFSKLDLRAGYHQIRLAAGEEYKTAFQTHSGHYEYKVLPFGVSGGPATFQGGMNHTLKPVSRRCAFVFFDDIFVSSISFEDHIKHLREVLQLLRQDQWQVKFS